MGASFTWTVVGSLAGVVGAVAAIVFGLVPLLKRKEVQWPPSGDELGVLPSGASAPVVVGEIPQEPMGFRLRADLLAALEGPAPGSGLMVVCAVTGMRGAGKTHLAAAYARAKLAERWRLVAWINAEDLGGILAGLAAAAAGLGLIAGDRDADAAGQAVRHWLETGGDRCLVVFDNAADPALLRPFIPAAGAARVIITSNERSVGNLGRHVPVDVFSEREALAFLAERTGLADTDGARTLAVELGCLPLALAQSAAVIADQHLDYRTYLDRLRGMPVSGLLAPVPAGQYPRGVAAVVLLSLDSAETGDDTGACIPVMELVAVLSPAGVRRAVLHLAGQQGVLAGNARHGELAAEAVDRALARLASTSLLTFSTDGSSVSAHRLVTRVIREHLAAMDSLAAVCLKAAQLLESISEPLIETGYERIAEVRDLIEQITSLHEASAGCPADDALVRRLLRLRVHATAFLGGLGDSPAQSISIAEPLLADHERILGPDHRSTQAVRHNLAMAYQDAGRADEAIPLLRHVLANRERVLGTDNDDTLRTRNGLANAYLAAGRTGEAITLFEQVLADRERILGIDHSDTQYTRGGLANAYLAAGRTGEAITLLEQILASLNGTLSEDHPITLRTRNDLANAYLSAGRTDEAFKMLEQVLTDRERVLGANHPDTQRTRTSLANSHRDTVRTTKRHQPPGSANRGA